MFSSGEHSPQDECYTKISEYFDRPDWWEDGRQAIDDFFGDGNTSSPAQQQDVQLNKLLDTLEGGGRENESNQVETPDNTNNENALHLSSNGEKNDKSQDTGTVISGSPQHFTNSVVPPEEPAPSPYLDAHLVQKDSAVKITQSDVALEPLPNKDTPSPQHERQDADYDLTNITPQDFDDATPLQSPIQEDAKNTASPVLQYDDIEDATTELSMAPVEGSATTTLSPRKDFTKTMDIVVPSFFPPNSYSFDPLPSDYQEFEDPYSATHAAQRSEHLQESSPASLGQESQDQFFHENIDREKVVAASSSDQDTNKIVDAIEPNEAENLVNLAVSPNPSDLFTLIRKINQPNEQQNSALTDRVSHQDNQVHQPMAADPSLLPYLHATWHQSYGGSAQATEQDAVGGAEKTDIDKDVSNNGILNNGSLFREVFPATLATRKRKAYREHAEEPPYKRRCLEWYSAADAGDDIELSTDVAGLIQPSAETDISQVIADEATDPRSVQRHSSSSSLSSLTSLGDEFNNTNPEDILPAKPEEHIASENKRKVEADPAGDVADENTDLAQTLSPREHIEKRAKLSLKHATRSQRLPDSESPDELSTPSKPLSLARPSRIPKPLSLAKSKTATPARPRTNKPVVSTAGNAAPKRTGVSARELDSMFNTSSWNGKAKDASSLNGRLRSESVAPSTRSTRANTAARDVEADAGSGTSEGTEPKAGSPVPRYIISGNELRGLGLDTPLVSPKPRRQGAVRRSASTVPASSSLVKPKPLSLANSGGQKTTRKITRAATTTKKAPVKGKVNARPSTRRNDREVKEEETATEEEQVENHAGEGAEASTTTIEHSELTEAERSTQVPEVSSPNTKSSRNKRATASKPPIPKQSNASKPPTPKNSTAPKPAPPKKAAAAKPATPKRSTSGSTPKKSKDTNTQLRYPKVQNKELAALKDWTVKDAGDVNGDEGGDGGRAGGGEGGGGGGKRTRKQPERFTL